STGGRFTGTTRTGKGSSFTRKARRCRDARAGPPSRAREDDAGRAPGLHHRASRRQLAGGLIDPERDDGVALEVGRVEQAAGRIEGEEARGMALRRLPGYRREPSVRRIDAEGRDAVVPAVRHVDEIARRRDLDLGGGNGAHE